MEFTSGELNGHGGPHKQNDAPQAHVPESAYLEAQF